MQKFKIPGLAGIHFSCTILALVPQNVPIKTKYGLLLGSDWVLLRV
jgi:hypothetical protein